MADYLAMNKAQLHAEKDSLTKAYNALVAKGLKLDMSRGKPAPAQLDLSNALLDVRDTVDEDGVDARNYLKLEGSDEARRYFADVLGVQPQEVMMGGSSSLMLMYNMVDMGCRCGFGAGPWKSGGPIKFLCPAPGYDRHFRVTEEFGFELVPVPMTPEGPDMDIVEKLVRDEEVKGIWCVPVYSNPDGYVYSDETVRRLAAMETAAPDFKIFWDNAYMVHHLTQVKYTCLNVLDACRAAGCEDRPLLFCSTSKITFAGAGVCALAASEANMEKIQKYYFPMCICFDKLNQLRHVRFLKQVGLDAHMEKHAALLAPKFQMVVDTLRQELGPCGPIARWTEPNGGYFISLYVMEGCAKRVVELCKGAGVVMTGAGAAYPYGKDPSDSHIRIAPSFPLVEELAVAAEVLCVATRLACVEKRLAQ